MILLYILHYSKRREYLPNVLYLSYINISVVLYFNIYLKKCSNTVK